MKPVLVSIQIEAVGPAGACPRRREMPGQTACQVPMIVASEPSTMRLRAVSSITGAPFERLPRRLGRSFGELAFERHARQARRRRLSRIATASLSGDRTASTASPRSRAACANSTV